MRTKPPPSDGSETIHGVVLHREDLERIIQSLEDRDLSVRISDSQTEYDDLGEVASQLGSQPDRLEIEGRSKTERYGSFVSLSFQPNDVHLYFQGSGIPKEAWYELTDFVRKCRSWQKRLASSWLLWYFPFLLGLNGELYMLLNHRFKFPVWAHLAAAALLIAWPVAYAYSRTLTTLRLTRRHEGGFWRRNADKIILLVIGAAVGAVIGGIATYLVTTLTRGR